MKSKYSIYDLYLDGINSRARELAIAKINAERCDGSRLKYWEKVMEDSDHILGKIVEMAIEDGMTKEAMYKIIDDNVEYWEKKLKGKLQFEVIYADSV